jgi:large subunit ribosomal protein L5
MAQTATPTEIPAPRLKLLYTGELRQRLQQELGLQNIMQVPRPVKIAINMGVGDAIREPRQLEGAVRDLTSITGQKPLVTKAKQSIAGFKIREGQSIGAKVTLRGDRMWEFLDRLVSIALPRIRDFRGMPTKGFDGHGNYTLGLTEQLVFPEVDYDSIVKVRGMDITVVTTAETNEHGLALLTAMGFPFRQGGQSQ